MARHTPIWDGENPRPPNSNGAARYKGRTALSETSSKENIEKLRRMTKSGGVRSERRVGRGPPLMTGVLGMGGGLETEELARDSMSWYSP